MTISRTADFWWLSEEQARHAWLFGVGHHEPWGTVWNGVHDPVPTGSASIHQDQPTLNGWTHSVNEQNEGLKHFKRYPVSFISEWRSRWENCNVYRTMRLWPQWEGGEAILGPFLVDIDDENEDLDDTLKIARKAVAYMMGAWKLRPEQDVRIFFSGRKGFNIEAIPARLGINGTVDDQIGASAHCLATIGQKLGISADGPTIDRVYDNRHGLRLKHPYIRLHDSFNCWRSNASSQCRRRMRLTLDELSSLSMARIVQLADAPP